MRIQQLYTQVCVVWAPGTEPSVGSGAAIVSVANLSLACDDKLCEGLPGNLVGSVIERVKSC